MRFSKWFYTLPLRVRSVFRRNTVEQELDLEMRYHLERQTQQNIANGLTQEEARYAAIGSMDKHKEECRDMRRVRLIQNLLQDLRFAGRMLRKSRGFTTIAILSLTLGIGANSAIFQLVNSLRIRSLPVANPEELAEIRIVDRGNFRGQAIGRFNALTNPVWERIRDQQQAFSGVFAWGESRFNLTNGGEKRFAEGLKVSGEFFRVLGVRPALGRVFASADDTRDCGNPGAVISYGFWQLEFGGRRDALGTSLTVNGRSFPIIGVTSANFFGVEPGRSFDVAIPLCTEAASQLDRRDSWWLSVIGRLKPGSSMEQANAQLQAISPELFQSTLPVNYPADNANSYLNYKLAAYPVPSGVSLLAERFAAPLWLLLATAGLVLLIACANLANLLLARGNGRAREVGVRVALGASRQRLICQLLVESLLLSILGGIAGAVLSRILAARLIGFLSTANNPLFLSLAPDWRVVTFMIGLTSLTCILFGLIPALRTTRTAPADALKSGGRGLTESRDRKGLRRSLVVSQVALSLLLLVGALLFTRTLINLATLDLGFNPENILVARVDLGRFTHPPAQRPEVFRQVLERLRSADGVDLAAQAQVVPLTGSGSNDLVKVDGNSKAGLAWFNTVSDGYFDAMGSSILAGRDFNDQDTGSSPKVALVNETFAREFLNGANPIGVQVRIEAGPGEPAPAYQVVGVVKDAKYLRLREPAPATVFIAARQEQPGLTRSFVIRSSAALPLVTESVTQVLRDVSPEISFDVQVLAARIQGSLAQEQLMAAVSSFFGAFAAALSIMGIYGVLSYLVAQRRNEIAIRISLGASRWQVVSMVLREATALVVTGLALGTLLSIGATRITETLLFNVKPNDPITLVSAIAILGLISAIASYLPARRAANVEPARALRGE